MQQKVMDSYKENFIEFLFKNNALGIQNHPSYRGNQSQAAPLCVNLEKLSSGEDMLSIGEAYAEAILANFGKDIDLVFSPSHNSIPLAVATAMQFTSLFGRNVNFCARRDYNSNIIIGDKPTDGTRIVIIEDNIINEQSVSRIVSFLQSFGKTEIKGLIVSLDRLEFDKVSLSQLSKKYSINTTAVINIQDVKQYLENQKAIQQQSIS